MTANEQPKMKDGIMRRGSTYTYVVRERDPKTGMARPRWVGGFPTRRAAKEARDAARASIHSGTYVAPQDLTVSTWLRDWMDGHEVSLKPSTAYSYRDKIRLYLAYPGAVLAVTHDPCHRTRAGSVAVTQPALRGLEGDTGSWRQGRQARVRAHRDLCTVGPAEGYGGRRH